MILDVTNLKLDDNQRREFLAVLAKYYESNFWIRFKSVGMMAWLALVLANSLRKFMSYGELEDPMSHWKKRAFQILEVVDQMKDLVYLYGVEHTALLWFAFCQTIILPFMSNVHSTNVIQMRDGDGKPIPFEDLHLLKKTLWIHFGFEWKEKR